MNKFIESKSAHLKDKYFQWRYWSHLYRNMIKEINRTSKTVDNCSVPYINKPGISFSFDDSYRVRDWYKYGKDLFGYYDVKVTFNMNGVNPLENDRLHTQEEIDMLLELQSMGHEIAHHGFKHKAATSFSPDEWLEKEIEPLFHWMTQQSHSITKEEFKRPVTFAFPHFVYDNESLRQVIPKYFKIARGHLYKDHLTPFNHVGFAPSICLDGYYSNNLFYIRKIMKAAKRARKNLIFTCHSILPNYASSEKSENDERMNRWGKWRISPTVIKAIIEEAKKLDLEFYTTAEIAGIATFIDPNFEKVAREHISNPSAKWVKISELSKVKELDLSNKKISNLAGLEYFINIEKVDLTNNRISDFRLLKKLPKLKQILSERNTALLNEKVSS